MEGGQSMTVQKLMKIYLINLFTDKDDETFEIIDLGRKIARHIEGKLLLEDAEFKLLEKAVQNKKIQMNALFRGAVLQTLKDVEEP